MMPRKPEPMICPRCGDSADWVFDDMDGEWELDGEWWYDPAAPEPRTGYTCSRWCYLKRLPTA